MLATHEIQELELKQFGVATEPIAPFELIEDQNGVTIYHAMRNTMSGETDTFVSVFDGRIIRLGNSRPTYRANTTPEVIAEEMGGTVRRVGDDAGYIVGPDGFGLAGWTMGDGLICLSRSGR